MNDVLLFKSSRGDVYKNQINDALKSIGANECDVLYVHTDMTFGLPNLSLKRSDILYLLYEVIDQLEVKTLVFPTFTFSFCNNEEYNVQKSRTYMGSLNEFVRKNVSGKRSKDPLLSVFVIGDPLNLIDNLSCFSVGKGSNYDRLHECGKHVKFLFFGADMRQCFTYTHYMETVYEVPYRYEKKFVGTVVDGDKVFPETVAYLYTTYSNCSLTSIPVVYDEMRKRGQLSLAAVGEAELCCFSERDAFASISELLEKDPLCLTDGNYDFSIKDKSYDNSSRIVSVK